MPKALSVRQPWAWCIVEGHKPLENRLWNTRFRGELLIHASIAFDKEGYEWIKDHFPHIVMPAQAEFARGGIVGAAEVHDVITASTSPWFAGPYAFCLRNAECRGFIPCKGQLGIFEVTPKLLARKP